MSQDDVESAVVDLLQKQVQVLQEIRTEMETLYQLLWRLSTTSGFRIDRR